MSGQIRRTRRTADFQKCLMPVTFAAATGDFGADKLRVRMDRRFGRDEYWQSVAGEASDEAMAIRIDDGFGGADTGRIRQGFPGDAHSISWRTCHSRRVTGDRSHSKRPFLFVRVPGTIGQVTGYLA